ncbi:MAG: Fic family protein [Aeromicrobium sp.]|uniref:Fic/DOC family protein n=1 Tax=Aeromicrobium sp. TaxID=1871063 RepID=UPI0039E6A5DA
MAGRFDSWESYFYPETFNPATREGTLRNLYDERDPDALARKEYVSTARRAFEIHRGVVDIPRTYDAVRVRAIHRYLFQDVYEWAGEERTVGMAKDVSDFADVSSGQVDRYFEDVNRIVRSAQWARLDRPQFARAAANVFAHLNQAHPFREGNGRTSKVFMEHVAEQSPYTLQFDRVSPYIWNNASKMSGPDRGSYAPVPDSLIPVFEHIAVERSPSAVDPAIDLPDPEDYER